MRGNSSLRGTADSIFLVRRSEDKKKLFFCCTKQKDGQEPKPVSGEISTSQESGVFIEDASENISSSDIGQIMESVRNIEDSGSKFSQIKTLLAHYKNDESAEIKEEKLHGMMDLWGIGVKQRYTYKQRLLKENVIIATSEKNVFIVN